VNHEQHANRVWFIPNRTDCVPALLSSYRINAIRANETKLIRKNESGQFEGKFRHGPADFGDF